VFSLSPATPPVSARPVIIRVIIIMCVVVVKISRWAVSVIVISRRIPAMHIERSVIYIRLVVAVPLIIIRIPVRWIIITIRCYTKNSH